MNYGAIKNLDIANGPGVRVSLFVSGCRNRCPGCFQPETWDFEYGQKVTSKTLQELNKLLSNEHVTGLSILGGDPFEPENQNDVFRICEVVRYWYPKKSIWVWTGYLWENIKDLPVMGKIDVVVDGPFIKEQKNLCLAYRGSENQRVIDVQKSLASGKVVLWKDPV